MTSIAQISENEQREIKGTLKSFFTEYHLSGLLKMCRAEKQKGHSAFQIFKYLLCQVFCDRSMYMQIVTGRYEEEFSNLIPNQFAIGYGVHDFLQEYQGAVQTVPIKGDVLD